MHSWISSRRHLTAIQMALSMLAAAALVSSSGSLAAQQALWASSARLVNALDTSVTLAAYSDTPGQAQSPAVAFDALNSRAGGTLQVYWDQQTAIPRFLTGNSSSARIPYAPTAAERGNPLAVARGFLDENRALFRLDAVANDFGPARMEPDAQLRFSNIRLPQIYNGIPVYGKEMVVNLDEQGRIVAVAGQYAPGLKIPSQPTITRDQAEQVALQDLKESLLGPAESSTVQANVLSGKTALSVYVDENGKATLSWNVKVLTTSPLGEWTIFVNARRPVVVHAIDTIDNLKNRETYSAGNSTDIPGRLLVQEGERTSDPVGQAAQDDAGKVYDYYFNTFKRDAIDGQGGTLVSTVHYGANSEDAENAAWISEAQQMVYGDGGTIFKPLAYALDVAGHEFTHGITDNTAQLIYEGQSGALNESYSDVFGAMIDRANWTIGETIVKSPPYPVPYLRSLQDPEIGGNYDPSNPLTGVGQPGTMSNYANLPLSRKADNGGVHINSGIPNHAAYFIAQAIGKEKMEQIYYRALTQYLTPNSNFTDAGRATVQAATDLYGTTEVNAVQAAFRQVGIDITGSQTAPAPPVQPGNSGAPTPGPSLPVPSETLPAGCRELIANGGFEGTNSWNEVTSSQTELIDPQLPHTGAQSAWLGGTDKESVQYIYQDVTVPANATSVRLSYYRLVHQEFSGLSGFFASDATFTALLADVNGNQIGTIESVSSKNGDDKWRQVQFDLTRYAGQTVRVVFTAANPRGNVSSFFVDDVTMPACTTGQAPSAPPTSSQNQVYINGYITSADTGRGIAGAQIFILNPGLTASAAAQDGQVTDDEVLTYGTTDSRGYYQTGGPVARGSSYSVIIIANGYRPVLADAGISLSSGATNPTEIDATMRAGR